MDNSINLYIGIVGNILGPLVVGLILWSLGERAINKRMEYEAIKDLMTFRGDFASPEFRRSLNKISITFHKDSDIRNEIRLLYEAINNPSYTEKTINRKIVGLIYKLCWHYGYKGITEYDIDQAFPESMQTPQASLVRKEVVLPNKNIRIKQTKTK